ncbi:hypothetical protein POTOM_062120 [Populus tomentosa]|uniref:RING-type domain-containing protein n=1 Tax=Populus tomentosa TaxID=118781 RepID=A0A8X8BY05_POPTO|nr:hypothetical protein POTOM_062120 [Populus tomentosa]
MEVRVVLAFAVDSWSPSETPPSPSCHIHTPQPSLHFSLLYLSIYTSHLSVFGACGLPNSAVCSGANKIQVFGQTLPAGDFQCWNFLEFHVSTIHGILAASPAGEEHGTVSLRNRSARTPTSSLLVRTAMRISRARWFTFLRRVFHYQNGSRSNLGSNPFNTSTWMMLEFVALVIQISVTMFTLAISKAEKPVWPVRIWIIGYNIGCVLSLLLLYGRYRQINTTQGDGFGLPDLEQQRGSEESSLMSPRLNQLFLYGTSTTTLLAKEFAGGRDQYSSSFLSASREETVDAYPTQASVLPPRQDIFGQSTVLNFDAQVPDFTRALLCNMVCDGTVLGYNMNMGSAERGASDDQISSLPSWRYKAADSNSEFRNNADCNSTIASEDLECCICLAKYKDKEEVRKLPCSHMFHLKCVDQWLRIISCCPLCKQGLER